MRSGTRERGLRNYGVWGRGYKREKKNRVERRAEGTIGRQLRPKKKPLRKEKRGRFPSGAHRKVTGEENGKLSCLL